MALVDSNGNAVKSGTGTTIGSGRSNNNGGRAGGGGVGSAAAKVAARNLKKAAAKKASTKSANKSTSSDAAIERESKRLLEASAQLTADLNKKAATKVVKPAASINYNTDDATETTKSKQSSVSITAIKPAAPKPSLLLDKTKPVEPSLVDSPKPEKAEEKGFFSSLKDAAGLLFDDPRTKESGRYNQKYWAERLAAGKAAGNTNIQAELAAEQAGQGGASKSYSQEKVPGYFEPMDHPSQKKIATLPKTQDVQNEIKALDNQIANETDPIKLKEAHKRRLMLMRMNNTTTKFAGLLDDADTKRSNLMSIS